MSYAEKRYQHRIIILFVSGKSRIQEVADWVELVLLPLPLELNTRKIEVAAPRL